MSKRPSRGVSSGVGTPTRMTGRNGDFSMRKTKDGKILYVKEHGSWHPINTGIDIKKIKADVDKLISTTTLIKSQQNRLPSFDSLRVIGARIDASPFIQLGSSDTECVKIVAANVSGGKGIDYVEFRTKTGNNNAGKGQIKFYVDDVYLVSMTDDSLVVVDGEMYVKKASGNASLLLQADNSAGAGDDWTVSSNQDHTFSLGNDLNSAGTAVTYLDITPHAIVGASTVSCKGNLTVATHLTLSATNNLYFDGGGNTYIHESAADTLDFVVGGDTVIEIDENGTSGNIVKIDGSLGFEHGDDKIMQPTYGDVVYTANSGNNTDIDLRECNVARLELTGGATVAILGFIMPIVSGNFTVALEQDGSGSGVVTAYQVRNFAGILASGSNTLVFGGGSNPTLTSTADKTDVLSIFWDAESQIAYAAVFGANF